MSQKSNIFNFLFFSFFDSLLKKTRNLAGILGAVYHPKFLPHLLFTAETHAFRIMAVTGSASANPNMLRCALTVFIMHAVTRPAVHIDRLARFIRRVPCRIAFSFPEAGAACPSRHLCIFSVYFDVAFAAISVFIVIAVRNRTVQFRHIFRSFLTAAPPVESVSGKAPHASGRMQCKTMPCHIWQCKIPARIF